MSWAFLFGQITLGYKTIVLGRARVIPRDVLFDLVSSMNSDNDIINTSHRLTYDTRSLNKNARIVLLSLRFIWKTNSSVRQCKLNFRKPQSLETPNGSSRRFERSRSFSDRYSPSRRLDKWFRLYQWDVLVLHWSRFTFTFCLLLVLNLMWCVRFEVSFVIAKVHVHLLKSEETMANTYIYTKRISLCFCFCCNFSSRLNSSPHLLVFVLRTLSFVIQCDYMNFTLRHGKQILHLRTK